MAPSARGRRHLLARATAPLLLSAGLLALGRWPAAQQAAPFLGLLKGPLGGVLLCAGAAIGLARVFGSGARTSRLLSSPVALGVASAIGLSALGLSYTERLRVSGDEPHYLLMAQSLWREGDLDLRDNLEREDFREYTPGPIAPHYGAPRADGRPFPAHSPGLPLLLAPLYALGGRRLCVVAMACAAALVGFETWRLALRATGDARAARLAWVAALGPPALFYSFHIYTEIPSALALALALRLLLDRPGVAGALLAGCLAGFLPWLHVKMIPAAGVVALLGISWLSGRRRWAFSGPLLVLLAALLFHYWRVFGVASPLAIYGGMPGDAWASPARALAGLLLDRSFGLLPHAPVFFVGLAGVGLMLRRVSSRERLAFSACAAAVLLPLLSWRMWWGGQCPPARFLVPLVPILGVALACRVAEGTGLARWAEPLLGFGYALAAFMALQPGALLLLNRGPRPTRVWEALAGDVGLDRYLPSLVAAAPADIRVAAVWTAALAAVIALDALGRRWRPAALVFRLAAAPLVLATLVGFAVDWWARPGEVGAIVQPPVTDERAAPSGG